MVKGAGGFGEPITWFAVQGGRGAATTEANRNKAEQAQSIFAKRCLEGKNRIS
jgi:hypothetical protein